MATPNPQLMPLLAALLLAHNQTQPPRTLPIGRPDGPLPVPPRIGPTPTPRYVQPIRQPGGMGRPGAQISPDRMRTLAAMQLALSGSNPNPLRRARPPGYSLPPQQLY
jgi:hypothetical protein